MTLLLPCGARDLPTIDFLDADDAAELVAQECKVSLARDRERQRAEAVTITGAVYQWPREDLCCAACHGTKRLRCCARCRMAHYCGEGCQDQHYLEHRAACRAAMLMKRVKGDAKYHDDDSLDLTDRIVVSFGS